MNTEIVLTVSLVLIAAVVFAGTVIGIVMKKLTPRKTNSSTLKQELRDNDYIIEL